MEPSNMDDSNGRPPLWRKGESSLRYTNKHSQILNKKTTAATTTTTTLSPSPDTVVTRRFELTIDTTYPPSKNDCSIEEYMFITGTERRMRSNSEEMEETKSCMSLSPQRSKSLIPVDRRPSSLGSNPELVRNRSIHQYIKHHSQEKRRVSHQNEVSEHREFVMNYGNKRQLSPMHRNLKTIKESRSSDLEVHFDQIRQCVEHVTSNT